MKKLGGFPGRVQLLCCRIALDLATAEMPPNIIVDKSFTFAVRIVKLSRYLRYKCKEFELSSQILRSGTSIGANINEALSGQSRPDFISKMAIAAKETRETKYWLRLLVEAEVLHENLVRVLITDCDELLKILNSIILSSQRRKPPTKESSP